MPTFEKTVSFYLQDFPRTLFPLDTNKVLVESFASELGDFVYGKITHNKESEHSFLPQTRAYAAKRDYHLRRTAKLDPVAEFFLYDLVYRNRGSFRKSPTATRVNFGYRFQSGQPTSPIESFRSFKSTVHGALKKYKHCARFDISSYFNSIYHHDLVAWFSDVAKAEEDALFFDKFLKQTNSGRSIDCLVHGIYPAKMIGSHFLSFVDNASWIASELMLRFMDDFYLFSSTIDSIRSDFTGIQRLLGEKGLSINPSKTQLGEIEHLDIEKEVDEVKRNLLHRRTSVIAASGGEMEEHEDEDEKLDEEEIEYLMALLKSQQIEEEDAELVLSLMRDYAEDVLEYLPEFLEKFPNLSKNIFYFCERIQNKEDISTLVADFIGKAKHLTEYQLFWLAKLLDTRLLGTKRAADIISGLYDHQNATVISKAKILEIADKKYGLPDLREEHLRTGASGWLSWSAAVGTRAEKKKNRNHILGYFANGSPMNGLIAKCVQKLP